ncbi:MFS transporter [Herbaspirillum sp. RTI4]|uniref:MFS transporter n=1 Tax=Herbaspirillum sp. RTI4 TaxID=3048640 RepID=UPI002B227140|nr:MFS transporter [Herbaspirillum sp. RTI4]MEA9982621.1 MFS transporter [Herbaspirillum sp. RTI4]
MTGVGMLSTDLYLPALPHLAQTLATDVPTVQATVSVYIIVFALSQLAWGWIADRLGMRNTLVAGIALQIAAGIACALAGSVYWLIFFRAVQGIGAGAATVVVPVLLRRRFTDAEAVRAISWVGIAESVIPAIAPVAGAAILLVASWRATFWVVALLALMLLPFVIWLVPAKQALHEPGEPVNYRLLLRNRAFVRDALIYGLTFGALVTFVASAPHLVEVWLGHGPGMFALMQVFGVSSFILAASRGSAGVQRFGVHKMMQAGGYAQLLAVTGLLVLGLADVRSATLMIGFWAIFCAGLGLRGPATMTRALSVPHSMTSLASGFLMFLALFLSGVGTQLAGFFLSYGMYPVALLMLVMIVGSLYLQRGGEAQVVIEGVVD